MKITHNWIQDWIEIKESPLEIAEILTMSGTEVKEIEHVGDDFHLVSVGLIHSIEKHPNADKLRLATVEYSPGEKQTVVCGAPNIEVGQKIAFAREGANLFMDPTSKSRITLKPAKIRGIESAGMICSERELGLGNDHKSGIIVLDPSLEIGQNLANALTLKDTVYDLEVTPNRGDQLSHYGIARELSALLKRPLKKLPSQFRLEIEEFLNKYSSRPSELKVTLDEPKIGKAYAALDVGQVTPIKSPLWLRYRLGLVDVREVNSIVDITNYVMFDVGQPEHAFDAGMISNKTIHVRYAKAGEQIITLDDQVRKLSSNMLVIADDKKALAIAGIMGGANSEITDNTESLVFEAANFDHASIRKTSTRLGLRSESSSRFEKYVDPDLRLLGLLRSYELINQIHEINDKSVSLLDVSSDIPKNLGQVTLRSQKLKMLLGIDFEYEFVRSTLELLGFTILKDEKLKTNQFSLTVEVPLFRPDVKEEADLVEEIGRIYGYENIPSRFPKLQIPDDYSPKKRSFELQIKRTLYNLGYTESYGYSLLSRELLEKFGEDTKNHVKILNPLQSFEYFRGSLFPGLVDILLKNIRYGNDQRYFEYGNISLSAVPNEEKTVLACIASSKEALMSFSHLKKDIVSLLTRFGGRDIRFIPTDSHLPQMHPSRTAQIQVSGHDVGLLYDISPEYIQNHFPKLPRASYAEIDIEGIKDLRNHQVLFKEFSIYPEIALDISFIILREQSVSEIRDSFDYSQYKHLVSAEFIEEYFDTKEDQRSILMRFVFQSKDTTLEEKDILPSLDQIKSALRDKFGAKIRDNV